MTTTMIATGGFGAFPENPLTQSFQEVIGKNIPADFLQPFNSYMENISAPTIQPRLASDPNPPLDLIGTLINANDENIAVTSTLPVGGVETLIADFSASLTASAVEITLSSTAVPTSTPESVQTATPTLSPVPSSTLVPATTPTLTFVPVFITSTRTSQPKPGATRTMPISTDTHTPTPTLTPTFTSTSTSTPTFTSTSTPTATSTPSPSAGSCVKNSPNTATYGCLVSNIRLDNVTQTSLTVPANQSFTLEHDFQVWSDPACPSCMMQIIAGFESTAATSCDYSNSPGVSPGQTGGSYLHTFTAPGTSGSYAIFVRWVQASTCNTGDYQGSGTVIALITVP